MHTGNTRWKASPESATWRGYPGQNGRWSDLSLKAINEGKATDRLTLKAILSISRAKLTKDNQLNYDLFRRNAEMAVEKQKFPGEFLVLNQMDGLPRDVPSMLEMMPAENVADYEDLLSRLKGVPTLVDQTIALLQEGLGPRHCTAKGAASYCGRPGRRADSRGGADFANAVEVQFFPRDDFGRRTNPSHGSGQDGLHG